MNMGAGRHDLPSSPKRLALSASSLGEVGAGNFFNARHAVELGLGWVDPSRLMEQGAIERVARSRYRLTAAETAEHYTIAAVLAG